MANFDFKNPLAHFGIATDCCFLYGRRLGSKGLEGFAVMMLLNTVMVLMCLFAESLPRCISRIWFVYTSTNWTFFSCIFLFSILLTPSIISFFNIFIEKRWWTDFQTEPTPFECAHGLTSFELVTGYVLTSPAESVMMIPGVLQLSDCIDRCLKNQTCKSLNFETGLCVLLTAAANEKITVLTPSQFPVFTIFAQKICVSGMACLDCLPACYSLFSFLLSAAVLMTLTPFNSINI